MSIISFHSASFSRKIIIEQKNEDCTRNGKSLAYCLEFKIALKN
jgi:hypothetical protein